MAKSSVPCCYCGFPVGLTCLRRLHCPGRHATYCDEDCQKVYWCTHMHLCMWRSVARVLRPVLVPRDIRIHSLKFVRFCSANAVSDRIDEATPFYQNKICKAKEMRVSILRQMQDWSTRACWVAFRYVSTKQSGWFRWYPHLCHSFARVVIVYLLHNAISCLQE